ncbi:MAG: PAS domain S-box protein [Deltaproteobacteria bacterium]|nr:PAS domain S-box protein [Deltaproteobacteria bacterium]
MTPKPTYEELEERIRVLEENAGNAMGKEDALHQSQEAFRSLFDDPAAVKLILDPETGAIVTANPAAAHFYGWSCERLAQMNIRQINTLPPDRIKAAMKDARDRTRTRFEFQHRLADGSVRDVEVFSTGITMAGKRYLHSIVHDITERKRAEREKGAISEIGRIIGASLNIDEVYERFVDEARKLIPFDRLSVRLIHLPSGTLRLAFMDGTPIAGRQPGDSIPLAGSLTAELLRTRTGMIADAKSFEALTARFPAAGDGYRAGMRSLLAVPLISNGVVIGSLGFRSKTPDAYTERDLFLAQRIGDQIAGAIANAQIYADLKRAEQEMAVIAEIGRIVGSSLNIDEVYERFTGEAKKLIGFDWLSVSLIDRSEGVVRIAHASKTELSLRRPQGDVFSLAGSLNEKIMATRKGLIVRVEERSAHSPHFVDSYKEGLRSAMSVPLFSQGEVIGTLNFRSKAPGAYTDRELSLAQRIGDQVAGAVANAKIYADLKRAEQEMAIIAEIGRIINSSLKIEEVYERFTLEARKLIGFDRLSVALHNLADGLVRIVHLFKTDITGRRQGDAFPLAGSLNEKLMQTRKGVIVRLDSSEAVAEHYPSLVAGYQAGVRSLLSVPLFSQGEMIGSLNFRSRKPGAFTPADLRLAERIGEQIAESIANATLYRELSETEKALRESNALFSHFMRHSPIYAFIKEVTPNRSIVLQASENYQQMIGIPGREMIGKAMEDLFPAEFAAKMTADDWAVVSAGKVLELEEELNGRSYATIKFPIVDAGKALLAGYTIDITERRQSYEALQKSEAQFRAIVENTHDGILFMDAEGKILYRSPSYRQINGHKDEAGRGRDLFATVHPDDLTVVRGIWAEMLEQPESLHELSYRILHRDQTWKTVESTLQNLLNNPNVRAVFMTTRDVTDRKRVEEQLAQAQKMEAVGRLAGGVAHDFNNMLGVILGHAELALDLAALSSPLQAHLQEIRKGAERSANLTRQLLAFARKQTVAPRVLDLNETVTGVLKMLQRIIGEDIDLVWRPEADLWPVKMDPSQVDQILANLCVNARDAISGVGKITIETANAVFDDDYCVMHPGFFPGDYVRLAVSDDGCGMDKETLAHLFEPFFTTKEIGKGTGLGLATVYGTVKQNNGFINVYSEPGQGTTFRIYFSRHAGQAEPVRPEGKGGQPLRGKETILVVEDEPGLLELTTTLLTLQGYTVLAAGTPGEAIRLASEHRGGIQLLMTDVVMPEMNGRELAKNLLALYPDLKRLFTSGYTANVIAHHGVLDQGVHFIQKPFSIKDLAAKVREVLDEK